MAARIPSLLERCLSYSEKRIISLCNQRRIEKAVATLETSNEPITVKTYAKLVRFCTHRKLLDLGIRIHNHITSNSEPDTHLSNALMTMYSKCRKTENARQVFDEMKEKDVCSWTVLIAAYARHGLAQAALELFHEMQDSSGIPPNEHTFSAAISACGASGDLQLGMDIHRQISEMGFNDRVSVMTALVDMYGKCGRVKDARLVFDEMTERNVVSWTAMIGAYVNRGFAKDALELFDSMQRQGIQPNDFTYAAVLLACADLENLEKGIEIHRQICRGGFQINVILATRLLNMYAWCGRLDKAEQVFENMSEQDTVLCNVMITGYAQNGLIKKALDLFKRMPQKDADSWNSMVSGFLHNGLVENALKFFQGTPEKNIQSWNTIISGLAQNGYSEEALEVFHTVLSLGFAPNLRTFASIIPACTLEIGMQLHLKSIVFGYHFDLSLQNSLIDMYAECGNLDMARLLFDKMRDRNVASWNTMIAGYTRAGAAREALNHYNCMKNTGYLPNQYTFAIILPACAKLGSLREGMRIHKEISLFGFQHNNILLTGLIDMYAQCGSTEKAKDLFDAMDSRDTISWNAMISGYMQEGLFEEAMNLFNGMPQKNEATWIIIISGFCQKGMVGVALQYFKKMPSRTMTSWNAIIGGLTHYGYGRQALLLFKQMQDASIAADSNTYPAILSACASLTSLTEGMEIHENVIRSGCQSDTTLTNALMNFYSKCGSIEMAWKLFDKLQKKDVISWNTMISGYAMHGNGTAAVELFEKMKQSYVRPNHITLLNVLSACNHAGLVEKGCNYFHSMGQISGIAPTLEHYKCLMDLLGRAGRFNEVENVIDRMPMKPDSAVWASLLAACRTHNNLDLAERVAEKAFKMNMTHAGPYRLLANMYAAAEKWADYERVQKLMDSRGIRKTPGYSWIEVNKEKHVFAANKCMPLSSDCPSDARDLEYCYDEYDFEDFSEEIDTKSQEVADQRPQVPLQDILKV